MSEFVETTYEEYRAEVKAQEERDRGRFLGTAPKPVSVPEWFARWRRIASDEYDRRLTVMVDEMERLDDDPRPTLLADMYAVRDTWLPDDPVRPANQMRDWMA